MSIQGLQYLIDQYNELASNAKRELQKEYNRVFDDTLEIRQLITDTEQSNEYSMHPGCGELIRSAQIELTGDYSDCREYLTAYLMDHYVYTDWTEGHAYMFEGPSIIVNDEGDVYDEDTREWIVYSSDYEDTATRNRLIEEHMERSGCYPGVFEVGRYGDVTYINTSK